MSMKDEDLVQMAEYLEVDDKAAPKPEDTPEALKQAAMLHRTLETIRLARLGLWAEQHAIPLLRESAAHECYVTCQCQSDALEALARLPQGVQP